MKENNAVGLSFLGLLTIVFIVLKLTGVIAWSWWFVLLPFWGPLAIGLMFLLVALMAAAVTLVRGDY